MRRKQLQQSSSICLIIPIITAIIAAGLLFITFIGPYSSVNTVKIIRWSSELDKDNNHHINDRRIYFHQTKTGTSRLNQRQTCAVESAAKHNPDRPIQVFMQAKAVDPTAPFFTILGHYQNVTIILLDKVEDYFRNSPLEKIYQTAPWNSSIFGTTHFSDYIRALSLYKGGGMYMDLDFVTLKQLDEKILWNFVPMEDAEMMSGVANTIFHFQNGHQLLPLLMKFLANETYDPHWLKTGPISWSNVVGKLCGIRKGKPEMNKCDNVKLLEPHYFNPLPLWSYERYFQNVTRDVLKLIKGSYAVQLWNSFSYDVPPRNESDELFLSLAKEHCPLTFEKIYEFK